MSDNCEHKFKIYKEFVRLKKNFMGQQVKETIYHLQCEKCGVIKTSIAEGGDSK